MILPTEEPETDHQREVCKDNVSYVSRFIQERFFLLTADNHKSDGVT